MKSREILAAIAVAAVLFGAAGLVGSMTNGGSTAVKVEETPSAVKPSAPTAPHLPPHQVVTLFDLIKLPYSNEWYGAMGEPNKVENIVDGTHCAMSAAECPHILVYNMTGGVKAGPIGTDLCPTTQQSASGSLRKLSDQAIDGRTAHRYEQELCPMGKTGAPSIMRYTWDIPGRLRIVATSTIAPLAVDDLNKLLANAKWIK